MLFFLQGKVRINSNDCDQRKKRGISKPNNKKLEESERANVPYNSPTHQTSPRSRHLHHSGRCPECSGHMHTETPQHCMWLSSRQMLEREIM